MKIKNILFKQTISLVALLTFLLIFSSCKNEKPMTNNELIDKAYKLAKQGNKWDEASKLASRAVKQDPKDFNAVIFYAITLDERNLQEQALKTAQAAEKLDKDNFLTQYLLGKILHENKRNEDALPHLKKAHSIDPSNINCLLLLAKTANILNDPDQLKYYAKLLQTDTFKNKPDLYNEMGLIFMQKGEKRKAAKFLLKADKLAKKNPTTKMNLAVFCDSSLKNKKNAIKFYKDYLNLTAHNAAALSKKRKQVEERLNQLAQ